MVTLVEIGEAAGIHRMRPCPSYGYNPSVDVLDRLCGYFCCRIEQLVEHIPGNTTPKPTNPAE